MKVAICLYGLHPKYCWKGKPEQEDKSYKYWNRNVFNQNYDVDIFLHSWSYNDKMLLLNEYKPKSYIIEEQISFRSVIKSKNEEDLLKRSYNMGWEEIQYSSTYSMKKSVELMRENENKKNLKYDFVMLARMDLLWLNKVEFENLDNTYFYQPIWGKDNIYSNGVEVLGNFFISNSNNIYNFSKLYDKLPIYLKDNEQISGHKLFKLHIDSITNNIDYKFRDCHSENPECDKQRDLILKNI
tara:strand:- start:1882 stop:2604 length:723 start_codon:yes stop_codon:yes gene_type:complete